MRVAKNFPYCQMDRYFEAEPGDAIILPNGVRIRHTEEGVEIMHTKRPIKARQCALNQLIVDVG